MVGQVAHDVSVVTLEPRAGQESQSRAESPSGLTVFPHHNDSLLPLASCVTDTLTHT